MTKRPWMIIIFAALWPLPLSAATVSFMVMESGLGEGQGPVNYSFLWENSLLDTLFDTGHIVSNAPMLRLSRPPEAGTGLPEEARKSFDEAREGGADYFILVLLDYRGAADREARPGTVSLRLFRVRGREFIAEQRHGPETENLNATVRKLIPYMGSEP